MDKTFKKGCTVITTVEYDDMDMKMYDQLTVLIPLAKFNKSIAGIRPLKHIVTSGCSSTLIASPPHPQSLGCISLMNTIDFELA